MQGLSDRVAVQKRTFAGPDATGRTTTTEVTKTIAARLYSASAIEARRANRFTADADLVLDAEASAAIDTGDRVVVDDHDLRAGTYEVAAIEVFPAQMIRAYLRKRA